MQFFMIILGSNLADSVLSDINLQHNLLTNHCNSRPYNSLLTFQDQLLPIEVPQKSAREKKQSRCTLIFKLICYRRSESIFSHASPCHTLWRSWSLASCISIRYPIKSYWQKQISWAVPILQMKLGSQLSIHWSDRQRVGK